MYHPVLKIGLFSRAVIFYYYLFIKISTPYYASQEEERDRRKAGSGRCLPAGEVIMIHAESDLFRVCVLRSGRVKAPWMLDRPKLRVIVWALCPVHGDGRYGEARRSNP